MSSVLRSSSRSLGRFVSVIYVVKLQQDKGGEGKLNVTCHHAIGSFEVEKRTTLSITDKICAIELSLCLLVLVENMIEIQ